MSKGDVLRAMDYLGHIVEAIDRVYRYVGHMTESAFLDDEKTQDAVVRNFEILGEAAHNVEQHHAAFAAAHPEVPWELMYTMRNRVAHGYSRWTSNWRGRPSMATCQSCAAGSLR